ncbi:hypothetical protein [Amycolatopsis sp. NPDC051061]|uniref:hypothetical protein n=1 Tax=Amycolatopsis sp. NPDC051061 TaxID=3155042 RepID=UPI0034254280
MDQSLVTSGFDVETLLSERYLQYLLFTRLEAGLFEYAFRITRPPMRPGDPGHDADVVIAPPQDYDRLYPPHPDAPIAVGDPSSFIIEIVEGGNQPVVRAQFFVTVTDLITGDQLADLFDLFVKLELRSDTDEREFEINHRLSLEVIDIGGTLELFLEAAGVSKDEMLAGIMGRVNGETSLGLLRGSVQQSALQAYVGGPGVPAALGVYVDLALKSGPGPDEYLPPRGNIGDGQSFLDLGQDLAFATSPHLLDLLGPDIRFRMAELKADGSGYIFPLRDESTVDRHVLGRNLGIVVGPEIGPPPLNLPTGRLELHLRGEYTDAPFDPNFGFSLLLRPVFEDGTLTWDFDSDLDFGLGAVVVSFLAGAIAGALFLNPVLGAGVFVGLLIASDLVAEPIIAAAVQDEIVDSVDLSFFDALPVRVVGARRRWDPLYTTNHQVVTLMDQMVINAEGIAFSGVVAVGKDPTPKAVVPIRDVERNEDGSLAYLQYRVNDFANFTSDFAAIAPGTDRRDYRFVASRGPTLVSLSDAQIHDRLQSDRPAGPTRLTAPISLVPKAIHVVDGQIDNILCIARVEITEQHDALIEDFKITTKGQILADQGQEIRENVFVELQALLGRDPTAQELNEAVNGRVDLLVEPLVGPFERDELPSLLEGVIARILQLDLTPEEYAIRQDAGVLLIEDKEIIIRKGKPYYRDRPDGVSDDNLLALPHYEPPYRP